MRRDGVAAEPRGANTSESLEWCKGSREPSRVLLVSLYDAGRRAAAPSIFDICVQCARLLMDHKGVYVQALTEGVVQTKYWSVTDGRTQTKSHVLMIPSEWFCWMDCC